jgi:hypothetical protein
MRTDVNGTAWFELREAGVYYVFCRQGDGWKTIEVKAEVSRWICPKAA